MKLLELGKCTLNIEFVDKCAFKNCLCNKAYFIGLTHNGFELGSKRDVQDLTFERYFKRIIVVELL